VDVLHANHFFAEIGIESDAAGNEAGARQGEAWNYSRRAVLAARAETVLTITAASFAAQQKTETETTLNPAVGEFSPCNSTNLAYLLFELSRFDITVRFVLN